MKERDMRPAVVAWLEQRGCTTLWESLLLGNCDVVGVRFTQREGRLIPPVELVVAVELKLSNVAGVIRQARQHLDHVHESYAAMPGLRCDAMRSATLQKFRYAGVGLLAVHGGHTVDVVVKARYGRFDESLRKRLWRRVRELRKLSTEGED